MDPIALGLVGLVVVPFISQLFKRLLKVEESRTEAAVDALLEERESQRSKSSLTPEAGASVESQSIASGNPAAAVRRVQARLERRLDDLERRQVIADDRNFALLRTYHAQGLAQSKISFWFSLTLGVAGFGLIVWAVVLMMRSGEALNSQGRATVPLIAGTVTQAVSALFFVQSNNTRKVMTTFFDKLRLDRNLDESLRLIDSVKDPVLQGRLQAVVAMHLVDSKISPSVLPGFGQLPRTSPDSSTAARRNRKGNIRPQPSSNTHAPTIQSVEPDIEPNSDVAVEHRST